MKFWRSRVIDLRGGKEGGGSKEEGEKKPVFVISITARGTGSDNWPGVTRYLLFAVLHARHPLSPPPLPTPFLSTVPSTPFPPLFAPFHLFSLTLTKVLTAFSVHYTGQIHLPLQLQMYPARASICVKAAADESIATHV